MRTNSGGTQTVTQPQLFSASGLLKSVDTQITGPLPCFADGNQDVTVMPDRYSKLIYAFLISKAASAHVENVFFRFSVVPHAIPVHSLKVNGVQRTCRLLTTLSTVLCEKHLTSTAYYPQFSGQVARCSHPRVTWLCRCVVKLQIDWKKYAQPVT